LLIVLLTVRLYNTLLTCCVILNNMDTRSNNKNCNKQAIQTTKDFVHCAKKWPALSPQTFVDKSEELLEKLSQLNSKMSRLESIPNQISNMASTLKTESMEVEQLHKEMTGLREENNSLREKISYWRIKYLALNLIIMIWNNTAGDKTCKYKEYP